MKEYDAMMVADAYRKRRAVLGLGLDHERVRQRGLRDLALPGGSPQAMGRKRGLPIGGGRDLDVLADVIIGARDDADAMPMRVVGELAEVGDQLLGVRHVQLAVRF